VAQLVVYNEGDANIIWVVPSIGGDTFENDGYTHLLITNGIGAKVMTITAVRDCDALHGENAGALIDYTQPIPENASHLTIAFKPYFYTGADGLTTVTFDSTINMTLIALRIRPAR
jgi:hypothetical protein